MRKKLVAILVALSLVLVVVVGACAPKAAPAQSVSDFYAKNVVTLITPFAPGGGTDYGARTFAGFWSDATGGAMIVKNMTAGSGMEGINFLYKAKPDGLTLGIQVHTNSLMWWLYNDPALQNEYNKFQFIGYFLNESFVFATAPHLKDIKSLADLQKKEGLKIAVTTPVTNMNINGAMVIELFNLKGAKLIPGYRGTADIGVSLGRGEIDATVNVAASVRDQVPQMANPPLVTLDSKRTQEWPDTPAIPELVQLSGSQKELFDFFSNWYGGKTLIAPPGTPADKISYLSEAFNKVLANPGYQAQAKLRWRAADVPIQGKDFARIVDNLWKTPEDFKTRVKQMVERNTKQ